VAQGIQDAFREQGFQLINPMSNDEAEPTHDELVEWASYFGLEDIPVLAIPDAENAYPDGEAMRYRRGLGPATVVHLAPDMRLSSSDEGILDPGVFLD